MIKDNFVTIEYQTYKEYCPYCNQDLDRRELSEPLEFDINIKDIFKWTDWENKESIYEEEIPFVVEEYLCNTISFYALHGNEELHLPKEEINKVEKLIKEVIENM